MFLDMMFFCKRHLPPILLILLGGTIVYANTFHVPFLLDDHLWITLNEITKNLENFYKDLTAYNANPNRFVSQLTLAINFHFSGFNVTGYHAVNLVIHLLTALLVYTLVYLTFFTPYFQVQETKTSGINSWIQDVSHHSSTFSLQSSVYLPSFTALLFVVHPVQTQAVTYIVQRTTSLATLFYLLSLVLYIQARLSIENSEFRIQNSRKKTFRQGIKSRAKSGMLLAGSVLAAVLAMRTKEISFTLPLAIGLYEVFFFHGPWGRRLLYLLPILVTLPIVPMTTFTVHPSIHNLIEEVGDQTASPSGMSPLHYLFTQFRVIVTYLRLLVLPVNQNLDYDYPVYTTFFTPPVFLSFLLLAAIFSLAVLLFRRTRWAGTGKVKAKTGSVKRQGKAFSRQSRPEPQLQPDPQSSSPCLRLIAFGILWFFLTLAVESSLVPLQDVIAEHRLYLPSIGAAITFSTFFFMLIRKIFRQHAILSISTVLIIIIVFGVATFQRNNVWGSAVGLWEDVVSKSPNKARSLNNLGQALNDAGRPDEAIPILSRVLAMTRDYDRANFNLARSYMLFGLYRAAIPLLQNTIRISPDFKGAYSDLAAALIKEKRYNEAILLLEKNLDSLGEMPEVRFNLGVAYLSTKNPRAARQQLEILYRLDSGWASKLADLLR
jgi:hypothetical protein